MCIKWQLQHMVSGGMTRPCSLRFSFVKAMIKLQRPCWDQGDRMWKLQKAWNNRCPLLCPCAHVPNAKSLVNGNEEHIHIIYLFLTRISIGLRYFQGLKSLHVDFTGTGDFCYHLFIPMPFHILCRSISESVWIIRWIICLQKNTKAGI